MRAPLVLFTPGPVQIPQTVAEHLADPPCNYHRQEEFRVMFQETQRDLLRLLGIRDRSAWTAAILTTTGTGANEACLLALGAVGRGLIVENGFFGARLVAQAQSAGIEHTALALPDDRPIDPSAVDAALAAEPGLAWVYFVSHETRTGLANPTAEIGRVAARRGVLVGADVVSHAFAYPLDLEASALDLAVTSSAKALMAAPGLGIVLARIAALPALRKNGGPRSYYLDLLAEMDVQRTQAQTRFAQPVALHAALHAACKHLRRVGVECHMKRIRSQMKSLTAHLRSIGVEARLNPEYRSWIAVNFDLPNGLRYPEFSRRMQNEGFYLLYGIPGDDSHFQISTIGDIGDSDVSALKVALTRVLRERQPTRLCHDGVSSTT